MDEGNRVTAEGVDWALTLKGQRGWGEVLKEFREFLQHLKEFREFWQKIRWWGKK